MYRLSAVGFAVFHDFLVRLYNAGFGSGFHRQVAQNNALVNGKVMGAVSGKLHDLIVGAVGSDVSDDGENQISGVHALPKGAVEIKADGFRNHDPGGAGGHGVEKVRTADAGTEGAQRPVSGGVGIRAENQLARADIVLHHDLMADTLAFVQLDAVIFGKITHFLVGLGSFRILCRDVMIHDEDHLIFIGDPRMF